METAYADMVSGISTPGTHTISGTYPGKYTVLEAVGPPAGAVYVRYWYGAYAWLIDKDDEWYMFYTTEIWWTNYRQLTLP